MNKVIVKSRIEDRDALESALENRNYDFGPIEWLHDRVYVPRGYRPRMNYPRMILRTIMHAVDEPPVYMLIFKRHIEDSGMDVVEETVVQDYAVMASIVMQLGFVPAGEISRRRQVLQLGENAEMYIDELDGATDAVYAKLEAKLSSPNASAPVVRESLVKMLKELGVTELVEQPYPEIN